MTRLACRSQLSSLKNEMLKLSASAGGRVARAATGMKGGGVKLLRRVYFPTPESLGRNAAHASSTRAAALRRFASDALAFQLVAAARAPTWPAVRPPGRTCVS